MKPFLVKAPRYLLAPLLMLLPGTRGRDAERWLRGREEYLLLEAADYALLSFGKSGRTWLRLMLSRFYQLRYGLPERRFLEFDNFHDLNPAVPKVFFTHGNYLRNYTGHWNSKEDFRGKRVVLLARDPRDIAVSQYFQWKYRMWRHKKFLNFYPAHGADVTMFDFLMHRGAGLPVILEWMNLWAKELSHIQSFILVRYEDLRADTHGELGRILEFMGTPASEQELSSAVEFAAYENMKKLEHERVFWWSGKRLRPGQQGNPESYKVRRAKIGGYRDYFEDPQLEAVDELVTRELDPIYGYGQAAGTVETREHPAGAVVVT